MMRVENIELHILSFEEVCDVIRDRLGLSADSAVQFQDSKGEIVKDIHEVVTRQSHTEDEVVSSAPEKV